ncbi:transportin-3 isoform X1 [Micractinium conductrix]|uniref:Transportin-3 isoform X1 n=1 Tax=Micractinium conductrix TaxID=554055 RepID=A0A2P6VDY7_9CHLO|nr:transportin-3 isoform X1 [Micractinium conductrix]|eukprot:PSC72289.1 transportin-3 isoform X1 [Micractinium conductrix]
MSTTAQLLQALQALYHGDPAVKDQANKWLEAFQQSTEAWQVTNDILHNETAGMEAHYFAAQTLRTKVQRDFEELPASAAPALRDSLLNLLVKHCQGNAAVRTQLCLAVAALAAHLPAVQWGPTGVVGWLAQRLGGEPQTVSLPCMLELLTVLPQEASSYQPAVRPERRRQVVDEMMAYAPQALQILASCLAAPLSRAREQALDAFTSWLKLTGGTGLNGAMLMQSPLVRAALEGLRSSDTFFAAVDAVIELIYCTSHRGRPKDDMAPLVQLIVPEVMALKPRFHVCLQQAIAERNGSSGAPEGDHDDSEEDAKGMARLFAEVGEAYTGLIAEGGPQVSAPVEALLDVASHPEDSICSMSFNFWHRLSRALTIGLHPEPLESEEGPVSDAERERRAALFTPTLERLVALIRGRVRFSEQFDSWHRDERQDFKRARVQVGDTLMDCAAVLGGGRMLQLLVEPLLELSKQVTSGAAFDWRTAEAALYCIRAVHRCAPLPGDALMTSLFASLPMLPTVPQLQYTVALTIGAYADWLADTARRSDEGRTLLSQLLTMLIRALSEPEASSASALSIRRLCDGCAPLLASQPGSVEALMALYRQAQGSGDVGQNEYNLDLDEDDVQQLIEGVALVASALPDGQRQACVQQMLDIVVQPMQGLLQAAAQGGSAPGTPTAGGGPAAPAARDAQLALVLPLMERVTTIFRAVKDPADVAEALVRLWPWIEAALDRFAGEPPAIERLCRAPRYAVRSAGKAAAGAVPLLVASLPQRFEASGQPCFLYVASELIKTFGDEPARDLELGGMFGRMMGSACAMLRTLRDIGERPDIADDTFLLAGRALSYAPRLLITSQLLPVLLDSALAGLLVQHREACCSILAFVVRLLEPATHRSCGPEAVDTLQGALAPRAPLLVRLLLAGVAGALPTSRLAELTDVLYALLKVTNTNGLQWVGEALAALPEEAATSADKQRYMNAAQQVVAEGMGVNDERVLQQAQDELSELLRRNRRSCAAAQRALLPPELHYIVR